MSLQINYKNGYLKNKTDNLVIFVDESFNILHLKKHLLSKEYAFISDLLKVSDKKSKMIQMHMRKISLIGVWNILVKTFKIRQNQCFLK